MNKETPIYIHLIGCILFLMLPILFSPLPIFSIESYTNPLALRDFLSYSLLIIFFYTNYYYLIQHYYFEKKYLHYAISLVICCIVILTIPSLIFSDAITYYRERILNPNAIERMQVPKSYFYDMNRYLFLFAGILFGTLAIRINAKLKESLQDKLNSELAYLKAQINPHFLFNTLNSIYSLAIIKSEHTPQAIVKLSSMMRYIISEAAQRFVPLDKEMIYINSYIELQKIRLDNTAIVNYSFTGETENKEIAPLVLLPFIENAFKHGVNPETDSQIDIQISVSDENLYMHVFNLKVPHINNPEQRTGFGLKNSKKQLQLIYPNKHHLSIEDKEHSFSVTLKINIT